MPFNLVRSKSGTAGNVTTLVVGSATTFVAGNMVVLYLRVISATADIASVVDDVGNVYTKLAGPVADPVGDVRYWQYYAIQQIGLGTTITITFTAAPTSSSGFLHEFHGGGPADVTASNSGSAGLAGSVALSPSSAGELIFAALGTRTGGTVFSPGAGYSIALSTTVSVSEYNLNGTTSETAPLSWTTSTNWVEIATAFFSTTTSTSSTSSSTSVSTSSTSSSISESTSSTSSSTSTSMSSTSMSSTSMSTSTSTTTLPPDISAPQSRRLVVQSVRPVPAMSGRPKVRIPTYH